MESIVCPHCGKDVELSQAIIHQLTAQVREEEKERQRVEFEKEKIKEIAEIQKTLKEEAQKELQLAKKEKEDLQNKLEKEEAEREKIEAKIKEEATRKAEDEQRLKLREKDIQIAQIQKIAEELQKTNEELKRKSAAQTSQQLQGEALELDFEEKLKEAFRDDEFHPVPKGVEGGDIWQKIIYKGKVVGSILWETKRTKAWQKAWLAKLREDTRKINASECIIISEALPPNSTAFNRVENVWITKYEYAINLAQIVRFLILSVHAAKGSSTHSDEDLRKIREYILSDKFRHTMESHFEHIERLKRNQEKQQKAMNLIWRDNLASLNKLDSNISDFYLDLKEIVPNIPSVKSLESPLQYLDDGNEEPTLF